MYRRVVYIYIYMCTVCVGRKEYTRRRPRVDSGRLNYHFGYVNSLVKEIVYLYTRKVDFFFFLFQFSSLSIVRIVCASPRDKGHRLRGHCTRRRRRHMGTMCDVCAVYMCIRNTRRNKII